MKSKFNEAYMKAIESVISEQNRASFEISDFIFHIIDIDGESKTSVVYLDEVELAENQKKFFIKILKEVSEGTQYVFMDNAVFLKEKCEAIADNPNDFNKLSREITKDFAGRHGGQMSPGVFVVANVKYRRAADDDGCLVFLVKMDKQTSFTYTYKEVSGRKIAKVDELENALNENKAAIQKSALIDVSKQFAWDVLAFDRVKKPYLSDYFKAFLGVQERQNDSNLTKAVHDCVRAWARTVEKSKLAPDEDSNTISGRSLDYLKGADSFDTTEFLNFVIRDSDPDRKSRLTISLKESLAERGLAGQRFSPKPEVLSRKQRKQIYQTAEGVTVTYEGTEESAGIKIKRDNNGVVKEIIIKTQRASVKA